MDFLFYLERKIIKLLCQKRAPWTSLQKKSCQCFKHVRERFTWNIIRPNSKTNSNYSHEILPIIKVKQESDKTWNLSERNLYLHPADVSISSDYSFYNQILWHPVLRKVSRPSKKSRVSLIYSILKKANVVSNQPSLFVALSVKHGFLWILRSVESRESKHGSNPVKISSKMVLCCHVTIRHIFNGIKRYLAGLVSGFTLVILNVEKAWEPAMIASVLQRKETANIFL